MTKIIPFRFLPVIRRTLDFQAVVAASGCMDMLHIGHVKYLLYAASLGTRLIVGVNSDASIRKLKGKGRPIFSEVERAEMLAALECVTYVVICDNVDMVAFLETCRPHRWVKGSDYQMSTLNLDELAACKRIGCEVVISETPKSSTTDLISKIKASS